MRQCRAVIVRMHEIIGCESVEDLWIMFRAIEPFISRACITLIIRVHQFRGGISQREKERS